MQIVDFIQYGLTSAFDHTHTRFTRMQSLTRPLGEDLPGHCLHIEKIQSTPAGPRSRAFVLSKSVRAVMARMLAVGLSKQTLFQALAHTA